MQRDTTGLNVENKELKLRLQAMEQQAKLRDGMLLSVYFINTAYGQGITAKSLNCVINTCSVILLEILSLIKHKMHIIQCYLFHWIYAYFNP